MSIIAISGKINSGKDTVGKIIQYLTSVDFNSRKNLIDKDGNPIREIDHYNYFITKFDKVDPILGIPKYQIKKFADKLKDIVCLLIGCTREQLEDQEFKNTQLGKEWWYYRVQGKYRGTVLVSYLNNDLRDIDKQNCIVHKLTPRLLLQYIGTECGRGIIHPDIWVNSLFSEYKFEGCKNTGESCDTPNGDCSSIKCYPNWIITDLRFPNELKAIEDRKGITIRVNRPLYLYCGDPHTLKELFEAVHKDTGEYPSKDYADKYWLIQSNHESETALDNTEFKYTINNDGSIEDLIEKVKEILIKENLLNN